MNKALTNDIDAPTISTSDTNINNLSITDHNVFYDFTGKNLMTSRMFGRNSAKKVWTPYIDNAIKLISKNQVEKSVTLMLGVPLLHHLTEGIHVITTVQIASEMMVF